VAAPLHPPAGKGGYMLITMQSAGGRGSHNAKLAVETGDDVAIPGFANKKQRWFAVRGSEDLVPPGYRRRDATGGGLGMFSHLVGALVDDNGTR
jgi:hypothetical protein